MEGKIPPVWDRVNTLGPNETTTNNTLGPDKTLVVIRKKKKIQNIRARMKGKQFLSGVAEIFK